MIGSETTPKQRNENHKIINTHKDTFPHINTDLRASVKTCGYAIFAFCEKYEKKEILLATPFEKLM